MSASNTFQGAFNRLQSIFKEFLPSAEQFTSTCRTRNALAIPFLLLLCFLSPTHSIAHYLNGTPIFNPDGTSIDPSNVPISPVSANMLKYFYPAPNSGTPSDYQNNYRVNYPAPISSDQADLRLDYVLTSKQSMFVRGTYKTRSVINAPNPNCPGYCINAGSPLTGAFGYPEDDQGVTFSHNYAISNSLVNEFRAGFNGIHQTYAMLQETSAGYLAQAGIQGLDPNPVPTAPDVNSTGFMVTGGGNPSVQHTNIVQALDNFTWSKGKHTFKFGADIRHMTDHDDNVFGNYRSGQYYFNNTTQYSDVNGNPVSIGDPYTAFLLGYPDYTALAEHYPAMNGRGWGYGFFGQDDWKITSRLTLNLGLRYELHPPLKDAEYNTAAFLPSYNADGVTGAVVVPNATALGYTSSDFAAAIAPSPILTAAQAGIPQALRYTYMKDFGPRLGFNLLTNAGSTRADRITGVPVYLHGVPSAAGDPTFLNINAFADPPNNSASFGSAGVGNVVGPGTQSFSMSLIKSTPLWEGATFHFGAEASNVFNHRNYETPDMNVDDGPTGFGIITALQTAEGAGPRNIEITGRISF
jgi:hypothetical protein